MLISRSEPVHWEILKWIVIYILAAAMAIMLAS
jgi:hypothetical protein